MSEDNERLEETETEQGVDWREEWWEEILRESRSPLEEFGLEVLEFVSKSKGRKNGERVKRKGWVEMILIRYKVNGKQRTVFVPNGKPPRKHSLTLEHFCLQVFPDEPDKQKMDEFLNCLIEEAKRQKNKRELKNR
jgi:hypothetical protein